MKSAGGSTERAHALAFAGIRETFEETGLLLGRAGRLDAPAEGTWAEIARLGVAPDPSLLRFLARAITPAESPMRFHARFFMADASRATGELRPTDELLDLAWFTLGEARKLPIIDVTEVLLDRVEALVEGWRRTESDPEGSTVFVSYRGQRAMLREEPFGE
jgi:8-oxo-dGTP pyrophosphatase MutT (NUDIX family)